MPMFRSLPFLLLLAAPVFAAGALPEPVSYTKPLADGQHVFVMLGDLTSEAKMTPSSQPEFQALREKYAKSGLYRTEGGEPVWVLDGGFAPLDSTFITSNGEYVIRLEGDWWRTKEYISGKRLPEDVEREQLAGPAVGFYKNGQLIRRYRVNELVETPRELMHSPQHVLWVAGAVLNEPAGKFVVHTQDANRIAFDYRTGEILSRDRVGLGNPILKPILYITGTMAVGILGVWVWLVFGRRRKPVTSAP